MTAEELERLAALIAAELDRAAPRPAALQERTSWLPVPVRPEPPAGGGTPPVWSGAAQRLGDIAPIRRPEPSAHRDDPGVAAAVVRAAAAGHAPTRGSAAVSRSSPHHTPRSAARGGSITVPIGVSNRHVHLSAADSLVLFGNAPLVSQRELTQPGQFAAAQRVSVTGPSGRIDGIRVVGPARGETQLELTLGDCARLGISAPIANSGDLQGSTGGVTLEGAAGKLTLRRGVIVAARHLHLSPADAARWHLADGDRVAVRCGEGGRATTWHGVLVRSGPTHATEFHLDVDEARACGVSTGAFAHLTERQAATPGRRPLLTERDVLALAARGEGIPANALLTPSALDRARALGMRPS